MTEQVKQEAIKNGVNEYINSDVKREKVDSTYLSEVLKTIGVVEHAYFLHLRETGDVREAHKEALDLLTVLSGRVYSGLVLDTDNDLLRDPKNHTSVLWELDYALKSIYVKERQKFDTMFPVVNRVPSLEEAYISHISDLDYQAPSFIYTDFLVDRDIMKFAKAMEEVYHKSRNDNELRTSAYFRLMYFLQGDPREYTIDSTRSVDWDNINRLVYQHILTSKELKGIIKPTKSSGTYYNDLDYHNNMGGYAVRATEDYESAYIGTLIYYNNLFPKGGMTKALQWTIRTLLRDQALTKDEQYNPEDKLEGILEDFRKTGASVLKIHDTTFIIGKKLMVVEDVRGNLTVMEVIPHSKVNANLIDTYTKKYRK